jgi:hypothetical protein
MEASLGSIFVCRQAIVSKTNCINAGNMHEFCARYPRSFRHTEAPLDVGFPHLGPMTPPNVHHCCGMNNQRDTVTDPSKKPGIVDLSLPDFYGETDERLVDA